MSAGLAERAADAGVAGPTGYEVRDAGAREEQAAGAATLLQDVQGSDPVALSLPLTVAAGLACVLRHAVGPGAVEEAAALAVGASFLALELTPDHDSPAPIVQRCVLVGERALPSTDGRLLLHVAGEELATCATTSTGDAGRVLRALAERHGTLAAGTVVVLWSAPRSRVTERSVVELRGPADALLAVRVGGDGR
ncbi:MAG: hypothetical protein JWR63_4545 [Conexibacter sp.]|nr:hypothetical protein [Conexibacter sp.]